MFNQAIEVFFGKGKYKVKGILVLTSNGFIVLVLGGEDPHIGAVAISVPRSSLKDKNKISSTTSVYTLVGHKDDEIAKPNAERLAREFNELVVVIAGIHVNDATEEEIKILINNSEKMIEKILKKLKKYRLSY